MTLPIAGWYPDPDNAERLRWWNGMAWTDNFSANPGPGVAAPGTAPGATAPGFAAPYNSAQAPPYYQPAAALKAPEGTQWNTVWIWLIVVMPILLIFGLFTLDLDRFFRIVIDYSELDPDTITAHSAEFMRALFSPALLLWMAASWLVAGLGVLFAYFDWRELKRRGVPQPFHWAWAFLQSGVYPIGRSVIARRRIGKGISPMWVTIIGMVLSFVIPFVYIMYLMFTLFDELGPYLG